MNLRGFLGGRRETPPAMFLDEFVADDEIVAINAFFDSGAFVDTEEGPHFCQLGKTYRVYVHGASAEVRADYISRKRPRNTMVFALTDGTSRFPVGMARILRIEDA